MQIFQIGDYLFIKIYIIISYILQLSTYKELMETEIKFYCISEAVKVKTIWKKNFLCFFSLRGFHWTLKCKIGGGSLSACDLRAIMRGGGHYIDLHLSSSHLVPVSTVLRHIYTGCNKMWRLIFLCSDLNLNLGKYRTLVYFQCIIYVLHLPFY